MICFVSILLVLFAPPLLTTSETTIASDISEDDNFDKQIISDLGTGKRSLLALGISKARFIILIGDSGRESNPNSIYVYEPPLGSLNMDSTQPQLKLSNGGPISSKYPAVYEALQGATVRNRTVIITDSFSGYLLFAFDSNGTTSPLLYSINEAKMVQDFKGAESLQTMLNQQYQVFTLISANSPMNFYSMKKYYYQEKYEGPNPNGNATTYCIFEINSWSFNDSTMIPEKSGLRLNHIFFESSICKDDSKSTVIVSKKCKYPTECLNWDIMAAFANEKRIYLLGQSMVHAVENVFSDSNVAKKKLSVVSFKLTDFLVTVPPQKRIAPPPPTSILFISVIALILLFGVTAVGFWLCMKKYVLTKPDATDVFLPKSIVKQSISTQAGTSMPVQKQTNPNSSSRKSKNRSKHSRKSKKKHGKSKSKSKSKSTKTHSKRK